MAIQWSATDGHMRVGMEVVRGSIDADTTSITIRVDYYVQSREWGYSDDQTLIASGRISQSFDYTFNAPTGSTTTKKVGSASFTQAVSYGGGPTLSFRARVTGAYDGSAPDLTISYTVPARPASAPSAVSSLSVSGVTSNYMVVTWSAPASNGASIDTYQVQVSTNSSFSALVWNKQSTDRSEGVSGLDPFVTYYIRVRAHNSKGWGAWSPTRSQRTLAAPPSSVRSLKATSPTPTTVAVSWLAPSDTNGAAITGYVVQWATNSAFTGASSRTVSASTLSTTLTGLATTTRYYVRVRADNSAGSTWSSAVAVTTGAPPPPPTGWFAIVGGVVDEAQMHVKVAGVWQAVGTYVKESNAWALKG